MRGGPREKEHEREFAARLIGARRAAVDSLRGMTATATMGCSLEVGRRIGSRWVLLTDVSPVVECGNDTSFRVS